MWNNIQEAGSHKHTPGKAREEREPTAFCWVFSVLRHVGEQLEWLVETLFSRFWLTARGINPATQVTRSMMAERPICSTRNPMLSAKCDSQVQTVLALYHSASRTGPSKRCAVVEGKGARSWFWCHTDGREGGGHNKTVKKDQFVDREGGVKTKKIGMRKDRRRRWVQFDKRTLKCLRYCRLCHRCFAKRDERGHIIEPSNDPRRHSYHIICSIELVEYVWVVPRHNSNFLIRKWSTSRCRAP